MTSRIFVPGYEVTFTIDSNDIHLSADSFALAYGQATLAKPRFGVSSSGAVGGQKTGTLNCSGHGTVEDIPSLAALRSSAGGVSVPFTVQYGDAAGLTDSGSDAGKVVIGEVTFDAAADGQLTWSLTGMTDDDVTYTAPTP